MLPLATVTALGFAMPLFLTALSVPLLRETVGWRRAAAVLVGFAGVVLMVRPWTAEANSLPMASVGFVLLGVVGWALSMVSIRRMGQAGERNVTIIAWFSLGSGLLAGLLSIPVWVTPGPLELAALVGLGLVSAAAQLFMTEAYRTGETTLIAPFEYSAIVYTTAIGLALWGEWPDEWDLAGVAVLVASGLFIWRREVVIGLRR